jgi:membrane protein
MDRTADRLRPKQLLSTLVCEWQADKLGDVAGAVAFSTVLALFPFLLFLVALAGLVMDPESIASIVDRASRVAPPQVQQILGERLTALVRGAAPSVLTVGALGALWGASRAVSSLTSALNTAFDVEETRPFWKVKAIAVATTLAVAALVVLASLIAVVTPSIAEYLGPAGPILTWVRIPAAALLIAAVLAVLYSVLPNKPRKLKVFTPGSVIAVLLWLGASLVFSTYVSHFGKYELVYGTLGGVTVLLLWIWLSSVAVVLGAEINAILERGPKQRPSG